MTCIPSLQNIALEEFIKQVCSLPSILQENLLQLSKEEIIRKTKQEIETKIYEDIRNNLPPIVMKEYRHIIQQRTVPHSILEPSYSETVTEDLVDIGTEIARNMWLETECISYNSSNRNTENSENSSLDSDSESDSFYYD